MKGIEKMKKINLNKRNGIALLIMGLLLLIIGVLNLLT